MVTVNVRSLLHHFSEYLDKIKEGEKIVVLQRNIPVADIIPHSANLQAPGWRRPIKKLKFKNIPSFSEVVAKMREEETR
ncbi:MAG: hypothetical protein HY586_08000 [Candidatus Omnitrophica bacterium]|nr:hypothetical protein [Candidatus Omnitrophota bacterium]